MQLFLGRSVTRPVFVLSLFLFLSPSPIAKNRLARFQQLFFSSIVSSFIILTYFSFHIVHQSLHTGLHAVRVLAWQQFGIPVAIQADAAGQELIKLLHDSKVWSGLIKFVHPLLLVSLLRCKTFYIKKNPCSFLASFTFTVPFKTELIAKQSWNDVGERQQQKQHAAVAYVRVFEGKPAYRGPSWGSPCTYN